MAQNFDIRISQDRYPYGSPGWKRHEVYRQIDADRAHYGSLPPGEPGLIGEAVGLGIQGIVALIGCAIALAGLIAYLYFLFFVGATGWKAMLNWQAAAYPYKIVELYYYVLIMVPFAGAKLAWAHGAVGVSLFVMCLLIALYLVDITIQRCVLQVRAHPFRPSFLKCPVSREKVGVIWITLLIAPALFAAVWFAIAGVWSWFV